MVNLEHFSARDTFSRKLVMRASFSDLDDLEGYACGQSDNKEVCLLAEFLYVNEVSFERVSIYYFSLVRIIYKIFRSDYNFKLLILGKY